MTSQKTFDKLGYKSPWCFCPNCGAKIKKTSPNCVYCLAINRSYDLKT